MKFPIAFTYRFDERDKVLNFLHSGGLEFEKELKLVGCWIAVQTGSGYAIVVQRTAKRYMNTVLVGLSLGKFQSLRLSTWRMSDELIPFLKKCLPVRNDSSLRLDVCSP